MAFIFKSDYLCDLVDLINKKRHQSVLEYAIIDLKCKSISEIHIWYDNILALVFEKPPKNYVKGIKISEFDKNRMEIKEYKYSEKPSDYLAISVES